MPTYSAAATIPAVDKDVPLSLFGGANTELSPSDLPEGGSPGSQDVTFIPGGTFTRPALRGILSSRASSLIVYLKTYVQPNGVPITLFLDSGGNLWTEYPTITPGQKTLLRAGISGLYAQSVTAFGREYIATSDGKVGYDVPLQFDGTYLDRVSQDGPGGPPTVVDLLSANLAIASLTPQANLTIASAIETGTLMTVTTTTAHGLYVNDQILVHTGNSEIDNDGQPILVQEVADTVTFSYEVGLPSLPAQSSGTVTPLAITLVTSAPHGLITDDSFVISGTGTAYDNNYNQVINSTAVNLASIS